MSLDPRRLAAWQKLDLSGAAVTYDAPMAPWVPLGAGGEADVLVVTDSPSVLDQCGAFARTQKVDLLILGRNPNVLVRDAGIRGVAVVLQGALLDAELPPHAIVPTALPGGLPDERCLAMFADPRKGRDIDSMVSDLGMRGIRLRSARLSESHGNLVVNEGEARSRDVLSLMDWVRERIAREWGVKCDDRATVVGRTR
jgi:UDP-N-acetylenolpyruvoylglucosamine reductase